MISTTLKEDHHQKFIGLSKDEKPTQNIRNGSLFLEMDTGRIFGFDEENSIWVVTPTTVDDIFEFDSLEDFPPEGSHNKIYIALDTGEVYRWDGEEYVSIGGDLSNFVTKEEFSETVDAIENEIEDVEAQVQVYNYVYPDENDGNIYFPLLNTKYHLKSLSSKGVLSDTLTDCKVILDPESIETLTGEQFAYLDSPITLYQTGLAEEMTSNRYGYDSIDVVQNVINRYCYAISLPTFLNMFPSTDFSWTGTGAPNGRLTIKHSILATKNIYTENGITPKYTRDIGLIYKGISTTNFSIDNLKSIQGINNKATAISVLSSSDYDNVILIFKYIEPVVEPISGGSFELPDDLFKCDGTTVVGITGFEGCAQISYLSLTDLVYSKAQADAKFLAQEAFNTFKTNNKFITELGEQTADNASNLYNVLQDAGYPKYAHMNLVGVTYPSFEGTKWQINHPENLQVATQYMESFAAEFTTDVEIGGTTSFTGMVFSSNKIQYINENTLTVVDAWTSTDGWIAADANLVTFTTDNDYSEKEKYLYLPKWVAACTLLEGEFDFEQGLLLRGDTYFINAARANDTLTGLVYNYIVFNGKWMFTCTSDGFKYIAGEILAEDPIGFIYGIVGSAYFTIDNTKFQLSNDGYRLSVYEKERYLVDVDIYTIDASLDSVYFDSLDDADFTHYITDKGEHKSAKTQEVNILVADWNDLAYNIYLSDTIGANDVLMVSPDDNSAQEYYDCGITRSVSGDILTLTASDLPSTTITVQVVYIPGEAM